ncbi:MAG: hypothetical protein ACE5K7_00740 [Phycisphaerae bacterium]
MLRTIGCQRPGRLSWAVLVAVFAVAWAARSGWALYRSVAGRSVQAQLLFPDEREYWSLAESLRQGRGLVLPGGERAKRMPLYPAMVAAVARLDRPVLALRLVQAVLGAAGAMAVAGLGMRLGGARLGLLSGLAAGLDPFAVFFSSLVLTEGPFVAALSGLMLATWPLAAERSAVSGKRLAVATALAIVCVYLRPEALGLVVLLVLLAAARRGAGGRLRLQAVALLAGVWLALLPWAARNRAVLGQWLWLTSNGGASLLDAQGPQADGSSNWSYILSLPGLTEMDELQRDRFFRDEALRCMAADPGRVLRLAGVKLMRTWNIIPNFPSYRSSLLMWVSAGWMVPSLLLAVLAVAALWRRWRIWLTLLLPAIYWTALHCVFVGSVRYRQPAMPFVELLACIGLVAVANRSLRGSVDATG